ncbi:MAG: methyltransferase domain-containing protein [Bacteroidetes bacterium]|jgi:ubiquinone/menaquinone biosynthesis C-methylase UbiE|nr:methyltransferase domain-containing protein [Bacteroidota bacterium]
MATSAPPSYQSANHHKYTVDNALYQWHLQAFLDELCAMLDRAAPQTVLDAGCGEGFVTDRLARHDADLTLTGIDLSEGAIAYARKHFGHQAQFVVGSIFELPFEDDQFDAVVCSEVLEHLDTPGRAVEELRRVARGHVLITVPREPYFQWLNDVGQWLGLSPDPGHVNFWSKADFQAFVEGHFDHVRFAWKHIYQLALAEV